jgi:hypothetical protein
MSDPADINLLKAQLQAELARLEAQSPAKDVAGRAIGKHGLMYITVIMAMGIGASLALEESKIAAVMGLLSAALMALIQMLNGVAGTAAKQEKPEFEVIKELIARVDKHEPPMAVEVADGKVIVTKGNDTTTMRK